MTCQRQESETELQTRRWLGLTAVGLGVWWLRRRDHAELMRASEPTRLLRHAANVNLAQRHKAVDGAINLRDGGGYVTVEGRTVRLGRIYRSGSLSGLTDEGVLQLAALRIRTVCDVRSVAEFEQAPDRLPRGVGAHHLPLQDQEPNRRLLLAVLFNRRRLQHILRRSYVNLLRDKASTFGRLVALAADEGNLPLLIHCTAGKDRTGLAHMLLLSLLGVPRDVIVADYALSNLAYADILADLQGNDALKRARLQAEWFRPILVADPVWLEDAIDWLEREWGSAEKYLVQAGRLDADTLARVRANLLE